MRGRNNMTIDLSDVSVFESNELELDTTLTFIFGRNGTGKSTLTEEFKKIDEFDVRVFDGFDDIVDENKKLNAVALGTENADINKKIEIAEKDIESLKGKIDSVRKGLEEPIDGVSNFWSRRELAKKDWNDQKNVIDAFFVKSAVEIKNKTNPQIAPTTYNRNSFNSDIVNAVILSDEEIKTHETTLRIDEKIAPVISFPLDNMGDFLVRTNNLLAKTISKRIQIKRIDGDNKKIEFAREGLQLHKKGDYCVFCGNLISSDTYDELVNYFSEDDYNVFQEEIISEINAVKQQIEKIKRITIEPSSFYPVYAVQAKEIKTRNTECSEIYCAFLESLKNALEEKQKRLLDVLPAINLEVPYGYNEIDNEYKELRAQNNNNDLSEQQRQAKEKLRLHYVKKMLDEFDYNSNIARLDILLRGKEQSEQEFTNEEYKISGPNGLLEQIKEKRNEILELKSKTKDETLLAQYINSRLKHSVSFDLVRVSDADSKGFYKIRDSHSGIIRDIDKVSTGEKNIIAFLYFIGSLREERDPLLIKPRLIVFDDPMSSNDDVMQYIIVEELKDLMRSTKDPDKVVLLTHNKHFYINVRYGFIDKCKKNRFIRFVSDGYKTRFLIISKQEDDFETSYEALWSELKLLYDYDSASPDILLNPIRRIVETFTKFNSINKHEFLNRVSGAEKLFNVNSHSIDDTEAELNGKNKKEIVQILCSCFAKNLSIEHFKSYWPEVTQDENGDWIVL